MTENNIQQVTADLQEVSDIVATHTTDSEVKWGVNGDSVKIHVFDEKTAGEIAKQLAECEYSYDMSIPFEAPIRITVRSKINPEL